VYTCTCYNHIGRTTDSYTNIMLYVNLKCKRPHILQTQIRSQHPVFTGAKKKIMFSVYIRDNCNLYIPL